MSVWANDYLQVVLSETGPKALSASSRVFMCPLGGTFECRLPGRQYKANGRPAQRRLTQSG